MKYFSFILFILLHFCKTSFCSYDLLDQELFESVLNPELCEEQLQYISRDLMLRLQFLDAGIRIPKGIFQGNIRDFGNYYQCLGIKQEIENSVIEGKYAAIQLPLNQTFDFQNWPELGEYLVDLKKESLQSRLHEANTLIDGFDKLHRTRRRRRDLYGWLKEEDLYLELALCIPKTCTTKEAFNYIYFNTTPVNLGFENKFYRLPGDKPWVPADYIAMVVFSIIGLLTILSTVYDINHTIIQGRNPKDSSVVYKSFSVYTNARTLLKITQSRPGALECLDGIRALSMMWVIMGHTFSLVNAGNILDMAKWIQTYAALSVIAGFLAVDTFFFVSGLLLVYVTANKMTSGQLLRNIHFFYLNRLLRMFPLLAATVLLQASLFNHFADGPHWEVVLHAVHVCRKLWWSTLLYVQNYYEIDICLEHTWYLAVDVQVHLLSPLILFWMLRGKRQGWIALTVAILALYTTSTIYNFKFNFGSSPFNATPEFPRKYYVNTLTRAAPLYVGMVFGYILHFWRGKKVKIPKFQVALLWTVTSVILFLAVYVHHPTGSPDWHKPTADALVNTYHRSAWAVGLGWIVLACVHGYGGPVNWLLSHNAWKLPSRLSYAMYLIHYPIMFVVNETAVAPIYFTYSYFMFRYCAYMAITFVLAFIFEVFIDMPFGVFIKLLIEGAKARHKPKEKEENGHHNSINCNNEQINNGFSNGGYADNSNINEKTQHQQL